MDDGWLLFDGVLRLPILLLCCCSLQFGFVAPAAVEIRTATLRHYISGLLGACCVLRPCVLAVLFALLACAACRQSPKPLPSESALQA